MSASLPLPPALAGASERGAPARPSFDALYAEHFPFVWRNLRRLGVAESALSDAAQDAFLVVHRRLDDYEPRSPLRSWIYSIVVRVARQHRRGRQRKPVESVDDTTRWPDPNGSEPERLAASNEALARLLALLDGLDDAKREAFVLSELEGLTAPEIAEILGVNVNTIYARVRAARKQLEGALAQLRREEA
ncbi:MAG TPA: RNA polymerase sigma factor [Polyangiaceae bacterium]|nr:RNA polymerase sigma factor [Polyangiaceae bacterium]